MSDSAAATHASGFAPVNEAQWRALVEKALKGADFERKLVHRTADGIAVKPLYARGDALSEAPAPGTAPFTRGTRSSVQGLGWDITTAIEAGDAATANRSILAELEGGANGVMVIVAGPGQPGVGVTSASDWSTMLTGVYLDLATLHVDAGLGSNVACRALLGALPALNGTPGRRKLCLGLDPIGHLARHGTTIVPIEAALEAAVGLACEFRAAEPGVRTMTVSGVPYHEAGASEAQELAAMAATLVAYLRVFEGRGIAPADAFRQMAVHLAADTDIFSTASKLRAARMLAARIGEASGASEAAGAATIMALTSRRMMAQRDPWTNMLRTTVATAAAAFGGADAILTRPFTDALGEPDAFARRIARNTQIVAQEESGLGRVIDPAGGSWYVEQLTDKLAREAWRQFQEIEATGGIVAALRAGLIQKKIGEVAAERAKAIATGRVELTGVSAFPLLGPDGVSVDPRAEAAPLAATLEVTPLAPIRLAAPFEILRDLADEATARTGRPPTVFLATLGPPAAYTARATWITNLLASGGIAVALGARPSKVPGPDPADGGIESPAAAAEAFAASGAKVAVIASSDAEYAAIAEPVALALKAAGATHVVMAGRPGEAEASYRASGVDRFIYAGQDAVATLRELQQQIGASLPV